MNKANPSRTQPADCKHELKQTFTDKQLDDCSSCSIEHQSSKLQPDCEVVPDCQDDRKPENNL